MLRISNREFKETFGHIAGSWRGKKPLQRNALLALGHYKDETAVDDMIAVMNNDPRPVIRGTAAWSLGKIGIKEAFAAIREAMEKETDEEVLAEMEKVWHLKRLFNAFKEAILRESRFCHDTLL